MAYPDDQPEALEYDKFAVGIYEIKENERYGRTEGIGWSCSSRAIESHLSFFERKFGKPNDC